MKLALLCINNSPCCWKVRSALIELSDMYSHHGHRLLHVVKVSASTEWDIFIIPNRAHPKCSKGADDLMFSALIGFGVSSKTSKFEE